MPKNYGYGVTPVKASKSHKFGRSRRKVAKKTTHKKTAVKTVMSKARSY